MSATSGPSERGVSPFAIFGIALVVAAAWAIYMGAAFMSTANFVQAALPTIVGVSIAVAAILYIGLRSPMNE